MPMPVLYSVSRSGADGQDSFTVVFDTKRINDNDLQFLRENAKLLLEKQDVFGDGVTMRETSLFLKNGRVISITRYQTDTSKQDKPPSAKFIDAHFQDLLKQLTQLIEVCESDPQQT